MLLHHVNPCDGIAFQPASEEEWINTSFYNLLQNSMGRMWGNKKMAPACIYTTWSGGGRSVSSHFPANSLPFVCCYSIWVIEHILVFNPRHSNVVYSFILKLLKTESKLKAFLIKRLKISTCHLDALNHMFSVLFLISIIGMKCYLFGTFFFSNSVLQAMFFSPHINWKYPTRSDSVCGNFILMTMTVFNFKISTVLFSKV